MSKKTRADTSQKRTVKKISRQIKSDPIALIIMEMQFKITVEYPNPKERST